MPTYDFHCQKCSRRFEAALPFGSKIRPPCPACGSARTEKLIAPPAIHFKGAGFFKTDSGKQDEKKEERTKGTEPAKKEAPTEKPEPKSAKPATPVPTQTPDTKPSS